MKRLIIGCLFFCCASTTASSQDPVAAKGIRVKKQSYMKFAAHPFFYTSLFQKDALRLILHYESQFKLGSKFTYDVVMEYHNFSFTSYANGVPVSSIPNNINIAIRPQIRYYLNGTAFHKYFVGAYPVYLYHDIPSATDVKGNYFGAGLVAGYQFFVWDRIPIEINTLLFYTVSNGSNINSQGQPTLRDYYGSLTFELNFGFPLRKEK